MLYLDDGTVITGTVNDTGNHTRVDMSESTVVTSSDYKLFLKSPYAGNDSKIRF